MSIPLAERFLPNPSTLSVFENHAYSLINRQSAPADWWHRYKTVNEFAAVVDTLDIPTLGIYLITKARGFSTPDDVKVLGNAMSGFRTLSAIKLLESAAQDFSSFQPSVVPVSGWSDLQRRLIIGQSEVTTIEQFHSFLQELRIAWGGGTPSETEQQRAGNAALVDFMKAVCATAKRIKEIEFHDYFNAYKMGVTVEALDRFMSSDLSSYHNVLGFVTTFFNEVHDNITPRDIKYRRSHTPGVC